MRAGLWTLGLASWLVLGCGATQRPLTTGAALHPEPPPPSAQPVNASLAAPAPDALSTVPVEPEAVPTASYPEGVVDDQPEADADPGFSLALGELSDAELEHLLADSPEALGGLSIGGPSSGVLVGGERMPDGDEWKLVDPGRAYGTRETCEFLAHAIHQVNQQLPGAHPLYIGHISAKNGGHLNPHKSHQAGRDVDISFYYQGEDNARWYKRGTKDNLDLPRTWAFVRDRRGDDPHRPLHPASALRLRSEHR